MIKLEFIFKRILYTNLLCNRVFDEINLEGTKNRILAKAHRLLIRATET